jgi:hypothetical protein
VEQCIPLPAPAGQDIRLQPATLGGHSVSQISLPTERVFTAYSGLSANGMVRRRISQRGCRVRGKETSHRTTYGRNRFGQNAVSPRRSRFIRKRSRAQALFAQPASLHCESTSSADRHGSVQRLSFSDTRPARSSPDVRLMPAQYIKPYVKTNKSDSIDAEATAEAVQRPTMRFVPIKTEDGLGPRSSAWKRYRSGLKPSSDKIEYPCPVFRPFFA